ncbi:SRPBCC family protein [Mycolicibacterium sp. XJ1819]
MTEIDVDHQINAVERKVGARTIDAGDAHVVTISQSYATDVDDLWDACTNIERIPRWLFPITGDLAVGGSYQLEGHAHGTILTCDPPRNFTATWEYGGNMSWIEVSIVAADAGSSRLVLDHIIGVDDQMWRDFGPGAVGMGWDSMLLGLALHTSSGQSIDPSFGQQWVGTEEGRRFLRRSGQAWQAAHVACGEEPSRAHALAQRCVGAYLGEPPN